MDYTKPITIVAALRDHDALVITLRAAVPQDIDMMPINAAAQAGVRWILPNEKAPDTANEDLRRDVNVFEPQGEPPSRAGLKLMYVGANACRVATWPILAKPSRFWAKVHMLRFPRVSGTNGVAHPRAAINLWKHGPQVLSLPH